MLVKVQGSGRDYTIPLQDLVVNELNEERKIEDRIGLIQDALGQLIEKLVEKNVITLKETESILSMSWGEQILLLTEDDYAS